MPQDPTTPPATEAPEALEAGAEAVAEAGADAAAAGADAAAAGADAAAAGAEAAAAGASAAAETVASTDAVAATTAAIDSTTAAVGTLSEDPVGTISVWLEPVTAGAVDIGLKLLGAIVLWFVGRLAIRLIKKAVEHSLTKRKIDATIIRYSDSALSILLNVLLALAILSVFGIETTTFAGLLAAAGVAIGMAWSGLLSNFAAGIFLILLRPFKVDDFIEAGGVIGTVKEIGLFVTAIDTMDNVRVFVGNNAVFSGNIKNFHTNDFRRVDLVAQLPHGVDPREAIEKLKVELDAIPNTVNKADVEILEFTLAGPVLAVRPYVHNDHYWQVYFDTNKAIRDVFTAAGYPVPQNHLHIQQAS